MADKSFDELVAKVVERIKINEEAKRRYAAEAAEEGWQPPPVGETLADALAKPRPETKYLIDQLWPDGGNAVAIAQYKTGKTTLLMNVIRSLADGVPFLNRFEVAPLDGRIMYWNYELSESTANEWLDDLAIENPERVASPWPLRGVDLPIWLPEYGDLVVDRLKKEEIEVWIPEPLGSVWSGFLESEGDNINARKFFRIIEQIMREAGVSHFLCSAHTGHLIVEEGEERARGPSEILGWPDAMWYLTKDKHGTRSMRALGRDVELEAFDLSYDGNTRRLRATGQTRAQRRSYDELRDVVDSLMGDPPGALGVRVDTPVAECPVTTRLTEKMSGTKGQRSRVVQEAERAGVIERYFENGERHAVGNDAKGRTLLCRPTKKGQRLHETGMVGVRKSRKLKDRRAD